MSQQPPIAFHLSLLGRGRIFASRGEDAGEGAPGQIFGRSNPLTPTLSPRGRGGALAFLAAVLFSASVCPAHAETDHAAIAKASLTEVIRPGYAALSDATGALSGKVEQLCKEPSEATLKDAKDAFAAAVTAWSKVEILRFGPITEEQRYERMFFWPDPKSLGLRQMQDALQRRDQAVTLPYELSKKSVALQGLPALEYLLYGDGADALGKGARVGQRHRAGDADRH